MWRLIESQSDWITGGGEQILMGCHSLSVSSLGWLLWVSGGKVRDMKNDSWQWRLFVFTLLLHVWGRTESGEIVSWILDWHGAS